MSPEWRLRLARARRFLLAVWRGNARVAAFAWRFWVSWNARTRMVIGFATLIMIAVSTASVAPTLSATSQGLATLLVALVGFWMIVMSPFRR